MPSAWELRETKKAWESQRVTRWRHPLKALKGPTLQQKALPRFFRKISNSAGKDHGNPWILRHTHTITNTYKYDYKGETQVACPLFLVFEPSRKRSYPMYWGGSRWIISTILSYYYDIKTICNTHAFLLLQYTDFERYQKDIYIYIYIYTHVYTYSNIHIIYVYIYIHIHMCMYL